jgi:Tfp pilus assembly protein PilN
LLHLPPAEERGAFLRDQISQMSWAGELEGWITAPPRRFLVAHPEQAAVWQPLLQEGIEQRVEVVPPVADAEVARLTARRGARETAATSLVPPEYTARYRQQFVDRIWMRAVFGVAIIYLFIVFIYLAVVQYTEFNVSKVEQQARNLSPTYTNAIRLKDQIRVMKDQLNLQFAALETYKAIAEKLPESVVLDTFGLSRGKSLRLSGTAPAGAQNRLTEFSDELRRYQTKDQQLLFSKVTVPTVHLRGADLTWNMEAELTREESE